MTAGWTSTWPTTPRPNFLYRNQKDGTFKELAFPMGVAVSEDGGEQGSMGVAVGDYDNSGRFSLFVTNFAEEYKPLYHNDGDHFTDVSFRSKTAPSSLPYVGWGTAFFDYDNDGCLDLIAVNGHVYPQLDKSRLGAAAGYRQRKLLYHNRGDGTFDEVAARFGPALTEERVSRGLAVGDLDNDGRLDVVINDLDGSPQLLRNELAGRRQLAAREARGQGQEHRRDRRAWSGEGGQAHHAAASCRAGPATSRRTTCAQHFGLGTAAQADSSRSAGPTAPGRGSRTSRPTRWWRSNSVRAQIRDDG